MMKKIISAVLTLMLALISTAALAELTPIDEETRTREVEMEGETVTVTETRAAIGGFSIWYDDMALRIDASSDTGMTLVPASDDSADCTMAIALTDADPEAAAAEKLQALTDAGWELADYAPEMDDGRAAFGAWGTKDSQCAVAIYTSGASIEINAPTEAMEGYGSMLLMAALSLSDGSIAPINAEGAADTAPAAGETWTGALLTGTLPKDAVIMDDQSSESADGYVQSLMVNDGMAVIVTGRFATTHALEAFTDGNFTPAGEMELTEQVSVAGQDASHMRYICGQNEDSSVVDMYEISAGEDVFLFLTCIDADAYYGYTDEEADYPGLVESWVESLQITEV